jgi:hypothetical protein
MADTH